MKISVSKGQKADARRIFELGTRQKMSKIAIFSKKNEDGLQRKEQVERKMVSEKVTIVNPSGLHLLNAVNLSNSVSRYKSSMSFTYENNGDAGNG